MGFKIKIQNVVASASLGVEINLNKITSHIDNTEYEPEQFPGLVLRLNKPKSATLVFTSGKLVCTGTKSPKEAKMAIAKVVSKIRKIGIKIPSKYKVKLENIVASAKLDLKINLDLIAFSKENTEYEPNQFPGLVYKMSDPKLTFLIFGSGSIVCTGGKTVADVRRAIKKLYNDLKKAK